MQGQTVPFWLQVTSIALAPFLGFVGLAIGVILAERNRRVAYVTGERRKAYQDYLEIATRINFLYSDALDNISGQRASLIDGTELQSAIMQLHNSYLQIRLVGSLDAIRAAGAIYSKVGSANAAILKIGDRKPIKDDLSNFIGEASLLQMEFVKVARKNLGLSPKELEIPLVNTGMLSPKPPLKA